MKDAKICWLASLQKSPKCVAFIEVQSLSERKSRVPSDNYLALFLIRTFDYFCALRYNESRKLKEVRMVKQKYYLALTTEEWWLMIECLNKLRNRLISEGRYTDAVDEVLIKVANAKIKKFKIAERRA